MSLRNGSWKVKSLELEQWFSKCSSSNTWELDRNADPGVYLQPAGAEALGMVPSTLWADRNPRERCPFQSKSHLGSRVMVRERERWEPLGGGVSRFLYFNRFRDEILREQ